MLRIKRAVQASYNTESSFIAAQAAAARKGTEKPTDAAKAAAKDAADPMAGLEKEANAAGTATGGSLAKKGGPAFVASTLNRTNVNGIDEEDAAVNGDGGEVQNPDAIQMDDEEF